jgi:hypothetical protein
MKNGANGTILLKNYKDEVEPESFRAEPPSRISPDSSISAVPSNPLPASTFVGRRMSQRNAGREQRRGIGFPDLGR